LVYNDVFCSNKLYLYVPHDYTFKDAFFEEYEEDYALEDMNFIEGLVPDSNFQSTRIFNFYINN